MQLTDYNDDDANVFVGFILPSAYSPSAYRSNHARYIKLKKKKQEELVGNTSWPGKTTYQRLRNKAFKEKSLNVSPRFFAKT